MNKPLTPRQAKLLDRLADGLDVLIRFHDREVDAELLREMAQHTVAEGLLELTASDMGQAAVRDFRAALEDIGVTPSPDLLDDLAANYADIYLTHGYRVAPNGSVWLTEDKLERQQPMFDVRDWYAHYDISVPDWRSRADDHLVHELQFVSFLCHDPTPATALDAGRFLDLHVLCWVLEFCVRAEERVHARLYKAVMALTRVFLEELRIALEAATGDARTQPEHPETSELLEDAPYVPGAAESW